MDKPRLAILLTQTVTGLLASGVHEDEDLFRNVYYPDLNAALKDVQNRYQRDYKVTLNIPANVRR